MTDRIEQEIVIDAPPERVWRVLTEAGHIGEWFCDGRPAEVDLRPGGILHADHGSHGDFRMKIVEVDPPRTLSYRWASGFPGEVADDANSTLVEFTLAAEGAGTRLKVAESGFTTRRAAPNPSPDDTAKSHGEGWAGMLHRVEDYTGKLAA